MLEDPATLQPYSIDRGTHVVTDASEHGLQGSTYQEKDQAWVDERNIWVPIDHVSRTLTQQEQRYSPIERESLTLSWGAEQFCCYPVGQDYTVWTDHKPLSSIYNNLQKPITKRIASHHNNIQDLLFRVKYMTGCLATMAVDMLTLSII